MKIGLNASILINENSQILVKYGKLQYKLQTSAGEWSCLSFLNEPRGESPDHRQHTSTH